MKRVQMGDNLRWSPKMEKKLLEIWADYFNVLRTLKHNRGIYEEIATKLAERGYPKSVKEVRNKIHNILAKYKSECSSIKMSNGQPSKWPLFEKVHEMHLAYKMQQAEEDNLTPIIIDEPRTPEEFINLHYPAPQLPPPPQLLELQTLDDLVVFDGEAPPVQLSPQSSTSIIKFPLTPTSTQQQIQPQTQPDRSKFQFKRRMSFEQRSFIMLRKLYRFCREQEREQTKQRRELLELQRSSNSHLRQLVEVSTNIKEALLRAVGNNAGHQG